MKKILAGLIASVLIVGGAASLSSANTFSVNAETLTPSLYSKIAVAINASETNTFEVNKNPELFDSTSETFINAVRARKDVETYASNIEASSAYEFSNKYASTFSSELNTGVNVFGVTTDISGKFKTSTVSETYKQKIESYQYYYWFTQKYVVNIDWGASNINNALSESFKRELSNLNNVVAAKQLLKKYGTHVYDTYILGGKLEITKYFVQDASYELSETEKNMAASLNVIVETAKYGAKVNGSVDLSTYESNSSTSSSVYTKLDYHAYGGNTNGAATASDLFQYKTQFGTGTSSGFLYEAWTNSFNEDNADLKIVSAEGSRAIWDILDKTTYSSQISLLKKAFDNMCYESYASKCEGFGVSCDYFSSLTYSSGGSTVSITPYESSINLPENTQVTIELSNLVTDEFDSSEYNLSLSSDNVASLNGNSLVISPNSIGRTFSIELNIYDMKAYTLDVVVKKELYSGGYGTAQQPYLLSNKKDLVSVLSNFASNNAYYKLTKNIDLNGEKIDVGGSGSASAFDGVIDGSDFSINNLTIKASTFNGDFYNIGVFGHNKGIIKNLIVENVKVLVNGTIVADKDDVDVNCGILVGLNEGVINNCRIVNSSIRISSVLKINTSRINVGGIVGYSKGLVQYSCINKANIMGIATSGSGRINVGGLIGVLAGATLEKSYVSDSLINASNQGGTSYSLGGLVGKLQQIKNYELETIEAKINTCLVYGLSANKNNGNFGYVAGSAEGGQCTNCYYKSMNELSIASSKANGCTRKDVLTLATIANSSFNDEWVDGTSGPVLVKHVID